MTTEFSDGIKRRLNETTLQAYSEVFEKLMKESYESGYSEGLADGKSATKYVAREIPSTVDGYNPQIPMYDESVDTSPAPPMDVADVRKVVVEARSVALELSKSANQQRAELIQRAREFVEENKNSSSGDYYLVGFNSCNADFIVNEEKKTVVCLLKGYRVPTIYAKGIEKCMPGDVFNEWIGKAIALAKALQIDIPQEFVDAVQPTEVVVGMKVESKSTGSKYTVLRFCDSEIKMRTCGRPFRSAQDPYGWVGVEQVEIIDDTNAIY